jgi:hypothetical protein
MTNNNNDKESNFSEEASKDIVDTQVKIESISDNVKKIGKLHSEILSSPLTEDSLLLFFLLLNCF